MGDTALHQTHLSPLRGNLMGDVGDELALRAGLDPGWDAALAAYLAGVAAYGTGPWVAASRRPAWRDA